MSLKKLNLALLVLGICFAALWVYRADHARLRALRYWYNGTVQLDGLTFHLNPDDKTITKFMVQFGCWEPAETAVTQQQIHPGDTVIDVGANIGFYTVLASRLVGPTGRVIAFEPDPTSFALLQRNIAANGCTNVVAVQKALSDKPGKLRLYIDAKNKGGNKIFQFEGARQFVDVEAICLDDYLKDFSGKVNFIKMDTEGAEGVILNGMQKTLARPELMRPEFFETGSARLDETAGVSEIL